MKQKQRVPKGKRYWYIIFDSNTGEFWVNSRIDYDYSYDEARFCNGNYFHSEEEAESMARKLRAVLKGADVIEMPSDEDISKESNSSAHEMDIDDGETPNSGLYWRGWWDAVRWLKSKIVK